VHALEDNSNRQLWAFATQRWLEISGMYFSVDRRAYRVRDLMSTSVITLTQGQSLSHARELMNGKRIRHLPVVDDAGLLVGLVTRRDVLNVAIGSLLPLEPAQRDELERNVPVARIMRERVWTARPDDPADAAAQLMLDHYIGCLPVTERGQVVGILTEADLAEAAAAVPPALGQHGRLLALADIWTPSPQVIEASQSLATAREVMSLLEIRHLPVLMAGELYGLLCERDLAVAEALAGDAASHILVGQVVSEPAFVVNPDARPEEVAIDMATSKQDAALAIRGGKIFGIITTADLARVLGLTLREKRRSVSPEPNAVPEPSPPPVRRVGVRGA
jgi:CBS domain-containing membrane protein